MKMQPQSNVWKADMPRRDFLAGSVVAVGAIAAGAGQVKAAEARAEKVEDAPKGMSIGLNLEYVRHADKSLEYGVYLGVEQHGPYTAKIKRMTRLLELVDSPWIRCNFDCGNTFLSGEDPYAMLEAVIDKVVHVHAKDISAKQAEAEQGKVTGTAVGCACGDGVIDWTRLVGRLQKAGFKGTLSVECGTENEAIRSLAHLTKVFKELNA